MGPEQGPGPAATRRPTAPTRRRGTCREPPPPNGRRHRAGPLWRGRPHRPGPTRRPSASGAATQASAASVRPDPVMRRSRSPAGRGAASGPRAQTGLGQCNGEHDPEGHDTEQRGGRECVQRAVAGGRSTGRDPADHDVRQCLEEGQRETRGRRRGGRGAQPRSPARRRGHVGATSGLIGVGAHGTSLGHLIGSVPRLGPVVVQARSSAPWKTRRSGRPAADHHEVARAVRAGAQVVGVPG